jgi:hypothetical protein
MCAGVKPCREKAAPPIRHSLTDDLNDVPPPGAFCGRGR